MCRRAWKVSPPIMLVMCLTRSTGQEAVNLPHIALPAKSPQFVAPLGESVSVFSFVSRCPFVRGEVARTQSDGSRCRALMCECP